MPTYDYDLFVIGAGSAGVRASRIAAGLGARVGIAEERYLGGTCVNVGCIPKKLFVYASHFDEDFEDAARYGWDVSEPAFEWARLRDNKNAEIQRLNGIYENLLTSAGVDIHLAHARVVDAHELEVDGRRVSAEKILVATGSWPEIPPIEGIEHAITSNEAFYLPEFPSSVAIIGGGYIAVEFAGIFAGLGAKTTLLYRGPLFLRGFDQGIREFVAEEIRKKGADLRFDATVERVEKLGAGFRLTVSDGSVLEADLVLCATGRTPHVEVLGIEDVGVDLKDNGGVIVDDFYQSSVPSIFAIGDVIDGYQLTPVALHEGMRVARNLFGDERAKLDYEAIPTAIFCQPNIGTVGPTEEEARERYRNLRVYESTFRPLKHTVTLRDERALMKLLVDEDTDRVIGAHMVGADAGEIVQGLAVAIKAGATKSVFDATIGIHPTAAEEFVTMREPAR
jgi:glutathione reductase (NADPH)